MPPGSLATLNPAGEKREFTRHECPTWLAKEHQRSGEFDTARPITAEFELDQSDTDAAEARFGPGVLVGNTLQVSKSYDNELNVAVDVATGDVWAVSDAGTSLLASGLPLIEGLAVDGDRLLAVDPLLKQVTAIDLATGATSPAIVGLAYSDRIPEAFFPFGLMSGVAIGGNDSIYVSDDGVNKVYEFRRSR